MMKAVPTEEPIHIGSMIEDRLKDIGMKKAEFARRIYCSRQNVASILKKRSINSEMLFQISEVLEMNFFAAYSTRLSPGGQFPKDAFQGLFDSPIKLFQESEDKQSIDPIPEDQALKAIDELQPDQTIQLIITIRSGLNLNGLWTLIRQHFNSRKTRKLG